MREHLRQFNPKHPWLNPEPLSDYEKYIYAVFVQCNRDRQYAVGMGGASPLQISLQTLLNYQALFGDSLHIEEIELIQVLDTAFLQTEEELEQDEDDG